jgi:hypothetical protein
VNRLTPAAVLVGHQGILGRAAGGHASTNVSARHCNFRSKCNKLQYFDMLRNINFSNNAAVKK